MLKKIMVTVVLAVIFSIGLTSCSKTVEAASDKGKPAPFRQNKEVETEVSIKIPDFTTYDLEGNEVTQEIFSEKDLTVVNIWGTYCGPCIGEMPELGSWAKELEDNVQIIGLVIDIADENDTKQIEKAKKIVSQADANFTHLIGNYYEFRQLYSTVQAVPTTIFIDSEGNIVGEPIVGAYVDGYKEFVNDYLGTK